MPQYELNIRDYLRILRKRRFVILLVAFSIFSFNLMFTKKQIPIYKSSVTIKIEQRNTVAGMLTEWILYNPGDVMESHLRSIKGYPVIKKVAEQLKMLTPGASGDQIHRAVSLLQNSIDTERIGNSNMIRINAVSHSPQQAMDTANRTAEIYIEENLLEKAKQVRHVKDFIEEQLTVLDGRLKNAENRLKGFDVNQKALKFNDSIQQKLTELEFELTTLLQKYTDKHPGVIEIQEQIKDLESRIGSVSDSSLEYSRITREIEVNRKLYGLFRERLEEARISEAQKVSDISIVDPAFMPTSPIVSGKTGMRIIAALFLGLLLGLVFAFVLETMDTSISTIEDVERLLKLNILGVIPSIEEDVKTKRGFLEKLRARFTAPDKKDYTGERMVRLISHFDPLSSAAEAYRSVFTNLKLDSLKKSILITSSGSREGKSTVAINLAIITAQTGLKTLLVSGDLRRPIIEKVFGLKKEPGLTDLTSGSVSLDEAFNNIVDLMVGDFNFDDIRKSKGLENLWVLTSGKLPDNPVRLFSSKEMSSLLEILKTKFDVILFDSAPVLPVSDPSIIAPKMDATVIVYEIGRTSREALLRTKIQLESAGAKLTGVILNNTQPQSEGISPYPYYYRYRYRYYKKEEDLQGKQKNILP